MDGNIEITNSNTYFFTDSLAGDMVIYTSSPSQHMLLGTRSNVTSVINVAQSLLTINRLSHISCNAIFLSNVGISTEQPKASLHTMRDVFVDSNDMPWPIDHGRGLYMRFFSSNAVDAGYIQSVERDGTNTQFQDLYVVASNLYLSTGWSSNTDAPRLAVKPSGRVGINTLAPSELLDVYGNIVSRSNLVLMSNQAVVYGSNVGTGLAGRIGYSLFGSNSLDVVGAATASQTGRYVTFYVNSNQGGGQPGRALFNGGHVLLNTGFIGIGASNPIGPLHIAAQNTTSNNVVIEGGRSSDNTNEGLSAINFNGYFSTVDQRINTAKSRWRLYVDQRSTADHVGLDSYNGAASHVYFTLSNSNMGVAKSNPVGRLHVLGNTVSGGTDGTQSSNNPLTLEDNSGGSMRIVYLNTHPTDSTVYNYQTNKNVYWGEATDNGAYLFRGRRVAIGTSNPDKALVVGSGSTDTSSALKINTGDADKLYITCSNNGSKISHGSGWAFNLHAGQSNSYSGVFTFQTGSNSGYLERMRIDTAGNLGINTAAPQSTLHVVGGPLVGRPAIINGASMAGTSPAYINITGRTNQSTGIEIADSAVAANLWKVHRSNSQPLLFEHATGVVPLQLSSNNVVAVASNLAVGVAAPESLVHVQTGTASCLQVGTQTTSYGATVGTLSLRGNNTTANRQWNLSVGAANSSTTTYDTQRLRFVDGATERMTLDASGFLGIGKANPTSPLYVVSPNANSGVFETSGGSAYIQFKSTAGSTCYIGTDGSGYGNFSSGAMLVSTWTAHPLILATNQAERMRIASDGTITVGGNLYPTSDNTQSLGLATNRWAAAYASNVYCSTVSAINVIAQKYYSVLANVTSYWGGFTNTSYGPGTYANMVTYTPDASLTYNVPTTAFSSFTPPVSGLWAVEATLAWPQNSGSYYGISLVKNHYGIFANSTPGGTIVDWYKIGNTGSANTRPTSVFGTDYRFNLSGAVYLSTSDSLTTVFGFTWQNFSGANVSSFAECKIRLTLIQRSS